MDFCPYIFNPLYKNNKASLEDLKYFIKVLQQQYNRVGETTLIDAKNKIVLSKKKELLIGYNFIEALLINDNEILTLSITRLAKFKIPELEEVVYKDVACIGKIAYVDDGRFLFFQDQHQLSLMSVENFSVISSFELYDKHHPFDVKKLYKTGKSSCEFLIVVGNLIQVLKIKGASKMKIKHNESYQFHQFQIFDVLDFCKGNKIIVSCSLSLFIVNRKTQMIEKNISIRNQLNIRYLRESDNTWLSQGQKFPPCLLIASFSDKLFKFDLTTNEISENNLDEFQTLLTAFRHCQQPGNS